MALFWVNAERIQNPTMTSLPNPASSGAKRMMVHVVKTNGNQPAARQCFVHRRRFGGRARAAIPIHIHAAADTRLSHPA